jgi:hypothetical protein
MRNLLLFLALGVSVGGPIFAQRAARSPVDETKWQNVSWDVDLETKDLTAHWFRNDSVERRTPELVQFWVRHQLYFTNRKVWEKKYVRELMTIDCKHNVYTVKNFREYDKGKLTRSFRDLFGGKYKSISRASYIDTVAAKLCSTPAPAPAE